MSTTIDQKVVEMRFDNQHFEKNVNTTMSSLDKLKQKLNFSGASKGLDELNNSAKNNNMNVLASSVEAVRNKFSALEVMGITALANITNSAVNAGKRIVKSLTIDPVTTGFSEYELKMGSVQTIMASTGESLEVVNSYLNELNKYSDQTIYSFSDMTQNIGKFTNAGVKLEDAVMAIKGISNEAALSGANANEASRAMYNFAQALSAGYVKLIDWKSIENANMATVGFKEQLIEAAVAAGTLEKQADGMYKVLTTNAAGSLMKDTISATKLFNDSLNYQWMTTEVLVNTLKDYADETTEIGKKASQAATEVKTFSQMMDTLKESAQSGWAQTWEIVFGDFYEGKELWTSISEVIGGLIDKVSDLRNNMLKGALWSPWDKLSEKIQNAGLSIEDFMSILKGDLGAKKVKKLEDKYGSLAKAIKKGKVPVEALYKALQKLLGKEKDVAKQTDKATKSVDAIAKTMENLDEIVKKTMRGDFGNYTERIKNLTDAGYDYATVQNRVNELMGDSTRHTSKLTEAQQELLKSEGKQVEQLYKLNDAQLKEKGYTEEQIKALRELNEMVGETDESFEKFKETMEEKSGRELLLESFQHIGEQIAKIFEVIKQAFDDVFGDQEDLTSGLTLRNLIEQFHELTTSMTMSEETAEKFHHIMEGLLKGFKLGGSMWSKGVYAGLKIFDAFLGLFDTKDGPLNIMKAADFVAVKISELYDWINEHTIFGWDTSNDDIAAIIKKITDGVFSLGSNFLKLEKSQAIIKQFKDLLISVKDVIGSLFEGLSLDSDILSLGSVTNAIDVFFQKVSDGMSKLDSDSNFSFIFDIASGILSALQAIVEFTGRIGSAITNNFGDIIGIVAAIADGISRCVKAFYNLEKVQKFIENIKSAISDFKETIKDMMPDSLFKLDTGELDLKKLIETINEFFDNIEKWIKGIDNVENVGVYIVEGLINGITKTVGKVGKAILEVGKAVFDTFTGFFIMHSPSILMFRLGGFIVQGLINGITNGTKGLGNKIIKIGELIVNTICKFFGIKSPSRLMMTIGGFIVAGLIAGLASMNPDVELAIENIKDIVINGFRNFGDTIANIVNSIDFGKVLAVGLSAGLIWAIKAMADAIELFTSPFAALKGAADAFSGFFKGVGKSLEEAIKLNSKSNALKNLAIAIAILAGSVWVLAQIDGKDLRNSVLAIVVLAAALVGMSVALEKLGKVTEFKFNYLSLLGIAGALLMMAITFNLVSKFVEGGNVGKTVTVFVGMVAGLAIIIRALGKVTGGKDLGNIKGVGKVFTKLAFALLIMVGVIKLIGLLEPGEIVQGIATITAITLLFKMLIKVFKGTEAEAATIKQSGKCIRNISVSLLLMIGVIKLASMLSLGEIIKGGLVVAGIAVFFSTLIKATKNLTTTNAAQIAAAGSMMLKISASMLIMAFAIKIIAGMSLGEIAKGLAVVVALSGLCAVLIAVSRNAGFNAAKAGAMILEISVALMIIGLAMYLLAELPSDGVGKALGILAALTGMFAILIAVTGFAQHADKVKGAIIAMAITIGIMAIALVALSLLPDQEAVKNATNALTSVIGMFALLVLAMSQIDASKKGFGKTIGTIIILSAVVAGIGFLISHLSKNIKNVDAAVGAANAIGIVLLALSLSLAIIGESKSLEKGTLLQTFATLAVLTGLAMMLSLVINQFAECEPDRAIGGAIGVGIMLLAISKSLDIVANSKSISPTALPGILGTMIILTAVAYALTEVIKNLNGVDPKSAIGNVVALGILLGALVLSFKTISKSDVMLPTNLLKLAATLGIVVAVIYALTGVIRLLNNVNPTNAIGSAIAMGILLEFVMHAFSNISDSKLMSKANFPRLMSTMGILLGAIFVIGLMIAMLSAFGNPTTVITSAIAIGLVLEAFAHSLTVITNSKSMSATQVSGLTTTLYNMLAALAIIAVIISVMSHLIKDPTTAIASSVALSILLLALSYSMEILSKANGITTAAVVPAMLMGAVLLEIALILGIMQALKIEPSIETAAAISLLLIALSAACLILSRVGPMAPMAVQGAVGLIGVITVLGVAALLLGEIMSHVKPEQIEKWKNGLETFLDFIVVLATGLGEAVGGFVKGAMDQIAAGLDVLGPSLSDFMDSARPFFDGCTTYGKDNSILKGASMISLALIEFAAADFVAGILTLGGLNLATVGLGLASFWVSSKPFFDGLAVLPEKVTTGAKTIAETLLLLTKNDALDAISGPIFGKSSLEKFGENFGSVGKGIKDFAANLDGVNLDNVDPAIKIVKKLANISKDLPNNGGAFEWLTGSNGLNTFASYLPDLGIKLWNFIFNVGSFSDSQVKSAESAGNVLKAIAKAASEIPNEGGMLGSILGENGLGGFVENLPTIGSQIKGFIEKVGEVPSSAADSATSAGEVLKALAKAANDIPNTGGKIGEWLGNNDLGTFASYLPDLGENIKTFMNSLGTLPEEGAAAVTKGVQIIEAIAEMGDVNIGVLTTDLGNFSGLLGGFSDCVVEFVEGLNDVSAAAVTASIDKIEQIIDFAKNVSSVNFSSLSALPTSLKEIGQNGVNDFIKAFTGKQTLTDVKNAAKKMMDEFIAGINEKVDPTKTAFEDIVSDSVSAIKTQSNYDDFHAVGEYLVKGFAKGISNNSWRVTNAAIDVANSAEQAAKDALNINSPSKVFMGIGSGVVEGFVKGIYNNARDSVQASKDMANDSIKGFNSAIGRINDYFSGNIDSQPTIRPVLDLSDVKSGAASIGGMFNSPTVGVAANVGAINTMMNQRNQNGANSDIISELSKLRQDLSNVGGGNTYQIGGITYDDGSAVSEAIGTLIRATRVDGRA